MLAVVAVETRQRAKRNKAAAAAEETPPPPPPTVVRRPRQPTPDHPPYCWMIGEAIDALGEDGGSSEDAISTFIRGAHPGVPAAHDRFLRHYLAKHVAEGLFVRTGPGRYARCSDEPAAAEEAPAERPAAAGSSDSEATRVEPPAKRRRGRPRKCVSSSSTPPAVKKGDGTTPKRRGRPRGVAPLATIPSSSVTAAGDDDEDGKQAKASKPRRRGRLRKLATTTDVPDEAPVTDIVDDGIDALPTTGEDHGPSLELALVVAGDDSTTTPTMDDNVCSEAAPTTPVDSDQSRELALVTTTDVPAPMSPMDKQDDSEAEAEAASLNLAIVVKQDAITGTPSAPERNSQSRKLPLMAADHDPVPVLACELAVARLASKADGGEAPSPMYPFRHPRKVPVIVAALRSALPPTSTAGKKARGKTLSATPKAKDNRRQDELTLVPIGAQSAPVAIKLAPVTAGGGAGAPSVPPKLYPLTADEIPADPSTCLLALPAATNAC
ncbi:hypothetical protein QOZ80_4AG0308710 [Eleusine coracana subsp. coracana]|nr:hypothetical protein QOZ80_4AG0308710 [Eleusine coracana subsp. coracana]